MAHDVIEIPGGGTSVSRGPKIDVVGLADEPLTVTVCYNARPINESGRACGVITFSNVMSYGWVSFGYSASLDNPDDLEFGLIEITDSGLIERLRKARPIHQHQMSALRHYRLSWNNYGTIDILCKDIDVRQTNQDCP